MAQQIIDQPPDLDRFVDEPPPDHERRGRSADSPTDIPPRGWKDVAFRVKDEVRDDHVSLAAAGVAFFGFLAIIPALAALVSIYGLFVGPDAVQARVEELFGALPRDAKDLLVSQLESIVGASAGALSVSAAIAILLALWSASSGMGHLLEAINVVYDERDERGFVARRALALGLTAGAVVFVVMAVTAVAGLPAILDATGASSLVTWSVNIVLWPVLAAGFAAGLAVIYRYAPVRNEPGWRWVTPGAVVAVVLWIVGSIGLRIYTANFASYNETYGSLAAVVVLLLWLHLTAFVVLLGAEINAETERQTAVDTTVEPARPMGERGAHAADTLGESHG